MKIKAHLRQREPGRSRRNGVMTGEVARAVRQAIFEGDYRPGDPLPELHLAKKYGVSQSVIRESLTSLAHAGLVRRARRWGPPPPGTSPSITSGSPNRAVALAEVRGPQAGLEAVGSIKKLRTLQTYYLLHAVLGELERRLNHPNAAAEHFRRALQLAEIKSEQTFLAKRLAECESKPRD